MNAACAGASPGGRGTRHPAEWERHAATWLGWPHNRTDWPGKMGAVAWAYVELCRLIGCGEEVRIWIADAALERRARRMLAAAGVPAAVSFVRHATNRSWTRDMGPLFLRTPEGGLAVADFHFNAWARYRNWQRDRTCAARAARHLRLPLLDMVYGERAIVLEGGALDVNGRGTLVTTEECLLDTGRQCRNQGLTRGDYERIFAERLGVPNTLWLGRGIAGDDTHGHVDDLARFVDERTLVLAAATAGDEENHEALEENRERAQGFRLEDGSRPQVVPIPMPAPLFFRGQRLPASYANFYIANAAVLVPTFNDPADRKALGILGELFRDRPVIGIHAVDLVLGLGGPHCLTHEEPAR